MLFCKILGSFSLIAAGGYLSFLYYSFEKQRIIILDDFIRLILYIKGQIDCYSMPLNKIINTVCKEKMVSGLVISDNDSFLDIISKNIEYLNNEESRLLNSFATEFGGCYKEEQLKRCDYYLAELGSQREKDALAVHEKIRLNTVLIMSAVLGVLIILW